MNERITEEIPLDSINYKVPIAIFVGSDDIVATPLDAEWTID